MLIPLQGEQADKSPFPPNARVIIYHKRKSSSSSSSQQQHHDTVSCSGIVTESLLEIQGANSCQILSKVKINEGLHADAHAQNTSKEYERICKGSELRLAPGSTVTVKINKDDNENPTNTTTDSAGTVNDISLDGVILGTVEVPMEMKQYSQNDFWYSVYIPSEDCIKHEVIPDQVRCQSNVSENVVKNEVVDRDVKEDVKEDLKEDLNEDVNEYIKEVEDTDASIDEDGDRYEDDIFSDVNTNQSANTNINVNIEQTKRTKEKQRYEQEEREIMHNDRHETTYEGGIGQIKPKDVLLEKEKKEQMLRKDDLNSDYNAMKTKNMNMAIKCEEMIYNELQIKQSTSFEDGQIYDNVCEGQQQRAQSNTNEYSNNNAEIQNLGNSNNLEKEKLLKYSSEKHDSGHQPIHHSEQSCTLFVGNIPTPPMTREELADVLIVYGPILRIILYHRAAMVEFEKRSDAEKCIAAMHNQVLFDSTGIPTGVPVRVIHKTCREDNECKLYARGLAKDVHPEFVWNMFDKYGKVTRVYLVRDTYGRPVGCAMVLFENVQALTNALNGIKKSKIPVHVCVPDMKSYKRLLAKSSMGASSKIQAESDHTESESIPSFISTESDFAPKLDRIHERNDVDLKRKADGNILCDESSIYMKRPKHTSSVKKQERYFAQLFFPIPSQIVAGCIIGTNGEKHKHLSRITACKIAATRLRDFHGHAVEVMSEDRATAENGALIVFQCVLDDLNVNDRVKQDSYIRWSDKSDESFAYHSPTKPSVNKFEHHWRVFLPFPRRQIYESLIGEDGSKHRKLRNQLKVNTIYLLPGSNNEAHCSIDIMDRSYSVSKNAAKSILRLLRKEYGTHLANARMEAMSACTKLEFDREE